MKHISREKFNKYNRSVSSKKPFQIIYYLCLIGIFSCLLLLFFIKTFIAKSYPSLNYKENSNIDYNIKLKPNEYYDTDTLPSGMDYIASLIDTINLKFNYTFTTNSNIDYNATYYIEAITRVYGKDNKNVLYEKKEILTDEEEINKTNIMASNFFKEVNIDYDHFNSFAKEFKTSYFISYDSDVTIVLHVNTIGKSMTFNKNIESDGIALVVIPLTEQTINVTIDSKNINNTGSIIDDDIWSNINYIYFSCFVIFFLIDLYFVYGLIKVFTKSLRNQSEYDKTLKRILRDYDSIIANSLSPIEDSDYKVLDLSSFDELRDVHDNLGMPIIFNEVIKGEISCFSITYDNLLYRYTLNANDLRKKWRQR